MNSRKSKVVAWILGIVVVLWGIWTAGCNGPTVGETVLEKIRNEYGMPAEEVLATTEMQSLIESGIPAEIIYAYARWGRTYPGTLKMYPVASDTTLRLPVGGNYFIELIVTDIKRGDNTQTRRIPKINLDEGEDGKSVMITFDDIPEEYYHQTFELPSVTIAFNYETQRDQIDYFKGSNTRRDIVFYVVSQREMDMLDGLHTACSRRFCNIPDELMNLK